MHSEKAEPLPIGRRSHPRLRLGVPATFITLNGSQQVSLDDLSQTGAQVTVSDVGPFSKGFLKWLDFEVFAQFAWQEGSTYGLRFDQPIDEEWLLETRRRAPGMLDMQKRLRNMARDWSQGAPDW